MEVLGYFFRVWFQKNFNFLYGLYGTILVSLVYLVLMEFPLISADAARGWRLSSRPGHLVNLLGENSHCPAGRMSTSQAGLLVLVGYPLLVTPSHLVSLNGRKESQAWKRVIPLASYCQQGSQSILFASTAGIT